MSQNKFGTRVHADAMVARGAVSDIANLLKSNGTISKKHVDVRHTFFVTFEGLTRHANAELMSDRTHSQELGADAVRALSEFATGKKNAREVSAIIKLPVSEPVPLHPNTITTRDIHGVVLNRLRNVGLGGAKVTVNKTAADEVWQVEIRHTHNISELPVRSKAAFEAALDSNPINALKARDRLEHTELRFEIE